MKKTVVAVMLAAGTASMARPVAAVAPVPAPAGRLICRVVGRHESIVVRCGANGPTYAVQSKTGDTIVDGAGLNQLAMTHPELARSIDTMQADASIDTRD